MTKRLEYLACASYMPKRAISIDFAGSGNSLFQFRRVFFFHQGRSRQPVAGGGPFKKVFSSLNYVRPTMRKLLLINTDLGFGTPNSSKVQD